MSAQTSAMPRRVVPLPPVIVTNPSTSSVLAWERSYSTTVEPAKGPWGDRPPAAEVAALYRVFLGTMALEGAVEDGLVRVQGLPPWSERFPRWFRVVSSARVRPGPPLSLAPAGTRR